MVSLYLLAHVSATCATHLRLRIFPDGGVMRLRAYGSAAEALPADQGRSAGATAAPVLPEQVFPQPCERLDFLTSCQWLSPTALTTIVLPHRVLRTEYAEFPVLSFVPPVDEVLFSFAKSESEFF